jgi:hypothetical protein
LIIVYLKGAEILEFFLVFFFFFCMSFRKKGGQTGKVQVPSPDCSVSVQVHCCKASLRKLGFCGWITSYSENTSYLLSKPLWDFSSQIGEGLHFSGQKEGMGEVLHCGFIESVQATLLSPRLRPVWCHNL